MTAFNRSQHPIGSEFLVIGIGEGGDVTHVEVVRYASNGFVCLRDVEKNTREWYSRSATAHSLKDICIVAKVEPVTKGSPWVRNPPLNEAVAYKYDSSILSAVSAAEHIREITMYVASGQMINAIKLYREVTGATLFDAKTTIDRYKASQCVV